MTSLALSTLAPDVMPDERDEALAELARMETAEELKALVESLGGKVSF